MTLVADSAAKPVRGPVDIHVHMVGNGSGSSGCWLRVGPWRRPLAALMLRELGLPQGALNANLEELYLERLLDCVRRSSLSHVVLLAQDAVYDAAGRVVEGAGTFYVPNDYVLALAREHPELLPAVSIHPARPDALEELDRCLAAGAVMLKLLPNCQEVDCSNRRFKRFWERMAAAKLPFLAHTGGEHTITVRRRDLENPAVLTLPLECGVNVIAAHCATKSGLFDSQYFHAFAALTRRFPNLYGDNSAFCVPIRGGHVRACLNPPLADRLLHGSDYPVPVHGHWAWLRGRVPWSAFRQWERVPNMLERDYRLKQAMGFAEETFRRAWGLLRLPEAAPSTKKPG